MDDDAIGYIPFTSFPIPVAYIESLDKENKRNG